MLIGGGGRRAHCGTGVCHQADTSQPVVKSARAAYFDRADDALQRYGAHPHAMAEHKADRVRNQSTRKQGMSLQSFSGANATLRQSAAF